MRGLSLNNGDLTFTDVTTSAGVGDVGYGLGVVAADYDQGEPGQTTDKSRQGTFILSRCLRAEPQ